MKKLLFTIILALLFVCHGVSAQNKTVSGKITDKTGPLPGASIVEKGQITNGTMTDVEGNFRLDLKGASQTLVVSMVGYLPKEVNVAGQSTVTILLQEDAKAIEEVVVYGYGEQRKVTSTGAVSMVSGEEIRENPSASLQNALVDKMPGFFSQQQSGRPGGDGATFYIRGVSSYNENNQPLIIVDDIEFSYDQFQRLDPNEIESVSILKDASTTAVYGIKGANGVLLVTTRRGETGKAKISVRTEYSMQQPAMFPEYLGSYESALLHNQARKNDANFSGSTYTPAFDDEAVEAFRTGSNPYYYPDVNWKEVLFKDFSNQFRTNLDISGGTERVKYFVSMGYLDQGGMLKNFGKGSGVNNSYFHRRVNYRSNLDMMVNKDLSLRLDLYGNIGQINNPVAPGPNGYDDPFYEYSSYLSLAPYAHPAYNPDGSIGYRLNLQPGRYQSQSIIARLTYGGYSRDNENNMNLVASASQKLGFITKGLSVKGTISYASTYYYTRNMTRSTFPSFVWDPKTDTYESFPTRTYRVQRFFDDYNARGTTRVLTLQAILNYDRTFGDHHVYGLALMNQSGDIRGGRSDAYLNYRPVGFRGYTGRIGYDYKDKYLFQVNVGYNGSPLFSSANRFGLFPAVSAGWNISEEPFFKDNIRVVDFFKIRASYGLVGNDRLGSGFSYYYAQNYTTGGGNTSFGTQHNNFSNIFEGPLPNFDVTWEKEKKFDVGLEFKFFKSRFTANLDYFNNERYDILTRRSGPEGSVSDIFGQTTPPLNLGRVSNKGYEIELIWRDNIGQDFSYNLRAMYSHAQNKILFRDEPLGGFPYQRRTGNNINTQLVYQWSGTFYESVEDIANSPKVEIGTARPGDLKYVDLNNDGVINGFDRAYLGDPANVPPTTFAFELGFAYKGFSIKSMFQGSRDFNVGGVAENIQFLGSNMQAIHQQAWTPELGNAARFPVLSENSGISTPRGSTVSTFWFIPGDFIRWRTAEISYTLPQAFVERLRMQSIRVYATGNNLLTWSKIQDLYQMDPEIQSGRDRISYPPQRIMNLGLAVSF